MEATQKPQAAALAIRRSVSESVLDNAMVREEETLADRRRFGLDAERWAAFVKAFFMNLSFSQSGPPLTLDLIEAAEREIGLTLPDSYRAFLFEHNGGIPDPDDFSFRVDEDCDTGQVPISPGGKMRKAKIFSFCPVGPTEPGSQALFLQYACKLLRQSDVPSRLAAIAEVTGKWADGMLCISCEGEDLGQIYLRPSDLESVDEGFFFVARSLEAFFDLISQSARPTETPQKRAERAIIAGDLDALALAYADGIDPTKPNRRNSSLLDLAAANDRTEVVFFLIERGTNFDAAFLAAVQARNVSLVLRLLETGEGPSRKAFVTAWLSSNLHFETKLVREFLTRGADPNQSNTIDGSLLPATLTSPLHGAAQAGNLETTRLLLDAGADPNVAGGFLNNTPLHMIALTPLGAAVGALLIDRGARVGLWNDQGFTALHFALITGPNLELARKMIDAGEDLFATGVKRDVVDGKEIFSTTRSPAMSCTPTIREELLAYIAARGQATDQG